MRNRDQGMARPFFANAGRGRCCLRRGGTTHGVVALALALAGCGSFNLNGAQPPAVDPNILPANPKAVVMSFLQQDPFFLVGAREAALSAPELKPFGTESRYVVCLRATGPDLHKEKMFVFYGGEVNQYVDATPEACGTANYQPFPELPAMLARTAGQKK
jgi:hypothetical protein